MLVCALYLTELSSFSQYETFTVDVTYSNPTCPGYSDGCIYINPTGGTAPYVIPLTDEVGCAKEFDLEIGVFTGVSETHSMLDVSYLSGEEMIKIDIRTSEGATIVLYSVTGETLGPYTLFPDENYISTQLTQLFYAIQFSNKLYRGKISTLNL